MMDLRGSNILNLSFTPSVEEGHLEELSVAGMKEENEKISVCRG